MKFSVVAAALASTSAVYGHSIMQKIYVNGVDQGAGLGSYIRNVQSNSPVKDVTSKDIICNVDGSVAPKTIEVSSGDVITMQWWHNTPNDDIIDPTHKGPLMVYIAPTSSNGAGAVWTKIFNQGYTDGWATDKLIAAKGLHSITVPDLAAGEYLIRPEIVALHEADTSFAANSARGAQFYMSCAQIKVVSTGSVKLGSGIDFNKDYTPTGTGILFNLYGGPALTSYVAPGGDVSSIAVSSQAGIGPIPAVGSKPTTQATSAAASTSAAAPTTTTAAPSTTAAPATSAAQTTSAVESTSVVESTSAPVPTTTAVASSTRAPLPTSKFTTVTVKSSSTAAATSSACPTTGAGTGSGVAVKKWYQCGGINYTGSTVCESGSSCVAQNPYYSQCL